MSDRNSPAAHVKGKALPRFLPESLKHGRSKTVGIALFAFVNGGISMGLLAVLAHLAGLPLLFPSLGPTAFLLFHRPLADASCPRNTSAGHLIGILTGWLSLTLLGLTDAAPILSVGVTWPRVAAAALSVGLTSSLMILLSVPHPPAGATTLIVSLGLIEKPAQYPVLMAGVVLLLAQGFVMNRLGEIPYPLWGPVDPQTKEKFSPST